MKTDNTEENIKKLSEIFENNVNAIRVSTEYKTNVINLIKSELNDKKTDKNKYDYLLGIQDEYIEKSSLNTSKITHETYNEIILHISNLINIYKNRLNLLDDTETKPSNSIKINWTGQSNTLTHLFRQLKSNVNKDKQPLITNSYEEIAQFLKENFTCFSDVKISTVSTQLKKKDPPKKTNTRIELHL